MIRGIINYLALKYPDYGFKKKTIKFVDLLNILKNEGVTIIKVDGDEMKEFVSTDFVDSFIANLTYATKSIDEEFPVEVPVLFYKTNLGLQKKWFAVAHEMGHFFLHKFFYNREDSFDTETGFKGWKGRLEAEADMFANHTFLPDIKIEEEFGEAVRNALLNGRDSNLSDLYKQIFEFCIEHCNSELGLGKGKLHQRGILNLKLRANKFISSVREELFLINHIESSPFETNFQISTDPSFEDPWEKYLNMKFKRGKM